MYRQSKCDRCPSIFFGWFIQSEFEKKVSKLLLQQLSHQKKKKLQSFYNFKKNISYWRVDEKDLTHKGYPLARPRKNNIVHQEVH